MSTSVDDDSVETVREMPTNVGHWSHNELLLLRLLTKCLLSRLEIVLQLVEAVGKNVYCM